MRTDTASTPCSNTQCKDPIHHSLTHITRDLLSLVIRVRCTERQWKYTDMAKRNGTLPNTNCTPTGRASNAGLHEDRNLAACSKIQSVPRSKHSVLVIQTSQLLLYREIIAVCSQIHTKHINTLGGLNLRVFECYA